jgi:hypothetical protein
VILARLVAFGKDAAHALSELDSVDLEAIALSHAWGISNGHTQRIPPSPCTREDCGGSVLIWDGERRCILCARPGEHQLPIRNGRREHGPRTSLGAL